MRLTRLIKYIPLGLVVVLIGCDSPSSSAEENPEMGMSPNMDAAVPSTDAGLAPDVLDAIPNASGPLDRNVRDRDASITDDMSTESRAVDAITIDFVPDTAMQVDADMPDVDQARVELDMGSPADSGISDAEVGDLHLDVGSVEDSGSPDSEGVDPASDGGMDVAPEELPPCEGGFEALPVRLDIPYANADPRQRLDLYPVRSERPTPLFIWIHGGGWRAGSKDRVSGSFLRFRDRGYTVASIEYRLSDAPWPATVVDVKTAIRFLRANAAEYNLDPNRFVAAGSSAGGHLVSMLGTSAGERLFRDEGLGHGDVSDAVQAVVNFYGPSDLDTMDRDAVENGCPPGALCHDCEGSPENLLIDCRPSQCTDRADEASPVNYVDGTEPPFLTFHGTNDCTVPTPQGRRLHRALEANGSESILFEVPNAGHNVAECLAGGNADRMYAFVERVIRGCVEPEPIVPDGSPIDECFWQSCGDLAHTCEDNPVCLALEVCFQDCFEQRLGMCIRRCLDSVPNAQAGVDAHRPMFDCGRDNGCYP